MNIPRLGPLRPDARIPEWLVSEPVAVPYFDGQSLAFTLDTLGDVDEADVRAAVEAFLALDSNARLAASPHVFANYSRIVDAVGKENAGCGVDAAEAIWAHVHPSEIFVLRRHRRDRAVYIQITAECDWEPEHGLQIIYRRGAELSRVSYQDGHLTHADAFGVSEEQDRIG